MLVLLLIITIISIFLFFKLQVCEAAREKDKMTINSLKDRADRLYKYNTDLLYKNNDLYKKYTEYARIVDLKEAEIKELSLPQSSTDDCPVKNACVGALHEYYIKNDELQYLVDPYDKRDIKSLKRALSEEIEIISIDISAKVKNKSPNSVGPYETTLSSCTCCDADSGRHHKPCKHMIELALRLGVPVLNHAEFQNAYLDKCNEYCDMIDTARTK